MTHRGFVSDVESAPADMADTICNNHPFSLSILFYVFLVKKEHLPFIQQLAYFFSPFSFTIIISSEIDSPSGQITQDGWT